MSQELPCVVERGKHFIGGITEVRRKEEEKLFSKSRGKLFVFIQRSSGIFDFLGYLRFCGFFGFLWNFWGFSGKRVEEFLIYSLDD